MGEERIIWTKKRIARTIDHAVLKPNMIDEQITAACRLGIKYQVASVCVRPGDVSLAAKLLEGSGVAPSAVVGFPHGSNRPEVKALEAKLAIKDGAIELDMVLNVGKFLSGDYDLVEQDIKAVVTEARKRKVMVKVILETCYLTPGLIAKACEISRSAGADYVKTSTGFGDGPATPEAVDIMVQTVGDVMGVKAAGGIKTYETAAGYLNQGCKRLGATATETIVQGAPEETVE